MTSEFAQAGAGLMTIRNTISVSNCLREDRVRVILNPGIWYKEI